MADIDDLGKATTYSSPIDGVFGRFKTSHSHEIDYILSSIRIPAVDSFVTAAEAFPFRTISFDELMQRDINYERVDEEIIKNYLERDEDKVIFFPPILVSVVAVNNERPVDCFEKTNDRIDGNKFYRTWDDDRFELELNISSRPTGYTIESVEHGSLHYVPYAASLRVNPERIKLVVIDGQHRFEALRRIHKDTSKRATLKDVYIPVCIIFTPNALSSVGTKQNIKMDMRDVFVTVNKESRTVSGHFIELLNDKSLSSMSARELANKWKDIDGNVDNSLLCLLEWNTREDRKANQRQKPFSITTISIVAQALRDNVFERKKAGLTDIILNLSNRPDINIDDAPDAGAIDESTFTIDQIKILKDQVRDYVVPSLHTIFTEPRPYKDRISSFRQHVAAIRARSNQNQASAKSFLEDVLYQFRDVVKSDPQIIKAEREEFYGKFPKVGQEGPDRFYFLNLFQTALITTWAHLCRQLTPSAELRPEIVAKALVAGLQNRCFNSDLQVFEPFRVYNQGILYKPSAVVLQINETARFGWATLIKASLLNEESIREFIDCCDGALSKESFNNLISENIKYDISEFWDTYTRESINDLDRNFQVRDLDFADKAFLSQRKGKSGEEKDQYERKLQHLVESKTRAAKIEFINVFSLDASIIKIE